MAKRSNTLFTKTLRGVKWSYVTTISNASMQIGYTAIMARLVDPYSFGLVAMSGAVMKLGSYFAQLGMGPAIVQKETIDTNDIRVTFTTSFFLGLIFSLLMWLLAPLALHIFQNDDVIPVLRMMGITFILGGFSSTSINLLRRDLNFKTLSKIEISSYVIGYIIVGISLGYLGYGVWGLVFASISQSVSLAILAYLAKRHNVLFLFKWNKYRSLLSYGSRISVISFFEYLGNNLDTFLIARYFGAQNLGFYNRAYLLIKLPTNQINRSFSKVIFPVFSRLQNQIERLKKAYLSSLTIMLGVLFPFCFGISVASKQIVLVLLGDQWGKSIPLLQLLALAVPFSIMSHYGGLICDATANLSKKMYFQIGYVLFTVIAFFLVKDLGLIAFAYAIIIGFILKNIVFMHLVGKILNVSLREFMQVYYPAFYHSIFVGSSIFIVTELVNRYELPLIVAFLAQAFTGIIVLFLLIFIFPRNQIRIVYGYYAHNFEILKKKKIPFLNRLQSF